MADDQKTTVKEEKKKIKVEAKGKGKQETSTDLDPKLGKILDEVSGLSVLELSTLVKAMEDKFGVQAAAAAPVAPQAGSNEAGGGAEEKSSFNVVLTDAGANKINVIKALREIKPDLGLKEAKDITEATPADILTDAKKADAEEAKKKLEEAGAQVELK